MEFAVLGTLRVRTDDGPIEITGVKERTVLARLIVAATRSVGVDELADTLWGDEPPRSAAKAVQNYVLRLRKALEPDRRGAPQLLVTDAVGYRLDAPADAVDARRFERLVGLGRRAAREGRTAQAAQTLAEALALWHGPAYMEFDSPTFAAERLRLDELRLTAFEDRIAADLELGRSRDCVPELEALVREHPLRERFWEQLVLALYRSGRQADALTAYARARDVLVDELGVEPGATMRALHSQVLAQDPTLSAQIPAPRLPPDLIPQPGVLVGRDAELNTLRQEWQRAQHQPITVLVRGAAGTGVHRLVAEFAAEVAAAGHEVLTDGTSSISDGPVLRVRRGAAAPTPDGVGLTVLVAPAGTAPPPGATTLDVGPLGPDDVRAILETYVDGETAAAALPEVLRRSSGRPGVVHDLGVDLARRRATARVGSAAAAANAGQRALNEARDRLRDGVTELGDVLERTDRLPAGTCPWKGLASYEVEDAPLFAGRERLVADLVARLATSSVLAVVGSSGSGKSSLVRAGLIAGLRSGVLPGSEGWTVLLMRPGSRPLRELARIALEGQETAPDRVADLLRGAVLGVGVDERTVLVVDQAEELFTACRDPAERDAFLETLFDLVRDDRRFSLVLVVRSDYAGELADRPDLARALTGATVLVGSPTDAEIRRAVELPAQRAGLVLDVGLTDALVADAGDRPGVLPLLSTALAELWGRRDGNRLTLAAYAASGGVSGAVARLAERTYGKLDGAERAAVRVLMLRLAGAGESHAVVRRKVPLAELEALPDPTVRRVVEPLADARLLTLDDTRVEVAHEALFAEWPRLRSWLEEDAASRAVRSRLAAAATDWDDGGREAADLWRGARLAAAVDLATTHRGEITAVESDFIEAGRAELERERRDSEQRARQAERQNRRLWRLLGGLALLLVAALVLGLLFARENARAEREALVAEVRELAAASEASLGTDPELAVLLALEAVDRTRSRHGTVLPEAEEALHRATTASRAVLAVKGIGGRVDWSPDGKLFVTEGPEESGLVDLRDATTGEPVRSWRGDDIDINMARFSPSGNMLASAGDDGTLRIWDPRTGARLHEFPGTGSIWSPIFSRDEKIIAAAWFEGDRSVARVWDLRSGALLQERPFFGQRTALAMSPDGRRLAAPLQSFETIAIWDIATGKEVLSLESADNFGVSDVDFSPDGRWIATGSYDKTARIWHSKTGKPAHTLTGHRGTVTSVAWSPDSRLLATGSTEGVARVWRVEDGAVTQLMSLVAAGTPNVYDVAFSPDGRRLMVGDEGVTAVTVFDVSLSGDAEVANLPGNPETVFAGAQFTPEGQVVASSEDGGVARWDLDDLHVTSQMPPNPAGPEFARVLELSPDGTMVAGMDFREVASVWDVEAAEVAFTVRRDDGAVERAAWSPNSRLVALPGGDVVEIVDRQGRTVSTLDAPSDMNLGDVAFTPDGGSVAAVAWPADRPEPGAYTVAVWDVATGEQTREIPAPAASQIAFSPDGTLLLVGSEQGPASVFDFDKGALATRLEGHSGYVGGVAFSPDGTRVATASTDGTARLWDPGTGISQLTLHGHHGVVVTVAFSSDGKRLVTTGDDGTVRVWALDLDELVDIARTKVTRSLSDAECKQYLHLDRCETAD